MLLTGPPTALPTVPPTGHVSVGATGGGAGGTSEIMRYPIVIHQDPESSYGVTVPDLPGCFSGGETLDAALAMAQEAIVGHIETLLMDGQPVPEQRSLQAHQADPGFADGIWALVDVDMTKLSGKAMRINVTMPARILAIADAAAAREGESRSGLLANAVLHYASHQTASD